MDEMVEMAATDVTEIMVKMVTMVIMATMVKMVITAKMAITVKMVSLFIL